MSNKDSKSGGGLLPNPSPRDRSEDVEDGGFPYGEQKTVVSFDDQIASTVYIEMDDMDDINEVESDAKSIVSSIMTVDGIADPTSFRVNCFAIFVGDMARGIFFPTMWNLVQVLGGDQIVLGYVTSSFSFGRMLVLPLFGKMSTVNGCRKVLLFTSVIFFIGTLMFTQVLNVGEPWFLILSNVVLGIGSGTLAVTRAYTSDVTPRRSRTGYMALISAIQYSGTTVTPLLGSLFVVMFANQDAEKG
jgi:ceroid-lipofuscinosis MFS transporter 7